MKVVLGRGKIRVDIEDGLAEIVLAGIREAAPAFMAHTERELTRIFADAVSRWPVGPERGRPHSRDLMTRELVLDPTAGVVEGRIGNTAGWAWYIKTNKIGAPGESTALTLDADGGLVTREGSQESPWQVLVRRPVREAVPGIASAAGRDLAIKMSEAK